MADPGRASAHHDPRASRAASATGVDERGSDHDGCTDDDIDDHHERVDDLDCAGDDADRGDRAVNVLSGDGASWSDGSLQGRDVQLLADPLGHLFASRRCCGLAHVLGRRRWRRWRFDGWRRLDWHKHGDGQPRLDGLALSADEDEWLQARRGARSSLFAGRVLQRANEGGALLVELPHELDPGRARLGEAPG